MSKAPVEEVEKPSDVVDLHAAAMIRFYDNDTRFLPAGAAEEFWYAKAFEKIDPKIIQLLTVRDTKENTYSDLREHATLHRAVDDEAAEATKALEQKRAEEVFNRFAKTARAHDGFTLLIGFERGHGHHKPIDRLRQAINGKEEWERGEDEVGKQWHEELFGKRSVACMPISAQQISVLKELLHARHEQSGDDAKRDEDDPGRLSEFEAEDSLLITGDPSELLEIVREAFEKSFGVVVADEESKFKTWLDNTKQEIARIHDSIQALNIAGEERQQGKAV